MNSLLTLSLALSTIHPPLIGQLYLQEPAIEYYFTRESGITTAFKGVKVGKMVEKGDPLVKLESSAIDVSDKVFMANTKGYIEFINKRVNTESPVAVGDLLLKVSSNYVLGNYNLDKSYDLSELSGSLWLCMKSKPVKFSVDSVLKDKLLISVELSQIHFSELEKLSEPNYLQLFTEKHACVPD
ncbi:hypothetical protein N473_23720 [Pseudoalteromonas luteoviolacea CPMOR-1]|uniref:Uncharacterized protein n=1 Tax=Pseudoalteromonas luteoviolacea CPMOR-1 TaxID=1365248 RepID=A0A167J7L6_9GAMM|nr:hypothetical protein [Pseudoalteromonas luteoviolacea]KZN60739.1 hypothetical protein N473_23720 [Pseudoalteromonas luteoviolacea CPMOR-1]